MIKTKGIRMPLQRPFVFLLFLLMAGIATAQAPLRADKYALLGDSLYAKKIFAEAARAYEQAARLDRKFSGRNYYNAACSRALNGQKDSAFADLYLAEKSGWIDLEATLHDADLLSLHTQKEWNAFVDEMEFQAGRRTSMYMWGCMFGILFVLFFYNLLLYFSIRDKSYLWYALSIFFYAHFEFFRTPDFASELENVFFWMRWIEIPGNGMTMVNLFMIFFILFSKEFLRLKENLPKTVIWINVFIGVFSILSIVLLVFLNVSVRTYTYSFILICYLFIYILAIICWRRGYKPARFFIIASTALFLGVNLIILRDFDLINIKINLGVYRSDNIGSIIFYILLSLALGDRINILKREKAEAQEKALLVLEERVKERTREVVEQKELIEEKQKEILDSIKYARRIQRALITQEQYIAKNLWRLNRKGVNN